MTKRLLIAVLLTLAATAVYGQELKVNLTINTSQLQTTNKQMFTTLENDLKHFTEEMRWTDMTFREEERIECNFQIVVNSYVDGLMQCELQVSATRPVYGTSYTTTLLNVRDQNVNFHYQEFDRLDLNTTSYDNNLTAIIAYWAYMIIGYDLDSFSKRGGQRYFGMAEQIVNTCQSKSDENEAAGWKAFESKGNRNRYALVNNLLDAKFERMRDFYYDYHRLALDNMAKNVGNGRAKIAESIGLLRELNRLAPSSAVILTFLDSKNDELINIFKKGTPDEKKLVVETLTSVNPTLSERYNEINQ